MKSLLRIPKTDIEVCRIGLGTADLGTRIDRDASFRLIDSYIEAGGNFLDSAHCYAFWQPNGLGAPERLIGAYLRDRRPDNLIVATKGGLPFGGPDYPRPDNFLSPETIAGDLNDSFDRLGLSSISLYYLHRDDPRVPVSEIMDALDDQVQAGRLQYIGASNWSLSRVAEANAYAQTHGRSSFVAIQNQWSYARPNWAPLHPGGMWTHAPEDVLKLQELAIAVIPYSSTANGYFSGMPSAGSQFDSSENEERRERVRLVAERTGATPTQVALAWLLNQPLPVVALVGTCSEAHLAEAMGAIGMADPGL